MASGTIDFTQSNSSGSYIDGKIVWTSTADTSANNSDVTAKIYVCKGSTTETLTIATGGTWSYSITINGSKYTGTAEKSVLTSWVYLGEYTVKDIAHGTDGKKSITISGSISAPSGTSYAGKTTSGSNASCQLDTISRPSDLTFIGIDPGDLSGTLTYKFTPKSTSFYNRVVISANVSGNLITIKTINLGKATSTSEQTKTTTFSSSELSIIYGSYPNTDKAKIRVTLLTYSNSGYSTQVGSEEYLEFAAVSMPASVKPTASLSVELVNNNAWIKSKNIYVAGYSGLKASLTATPGTGAKNSSYAISGGGYSSNTNALTIGTITSSGNLTLTGTAKDSRGRSGSDSKTITILPYSKPKITKFITERGTHIVDENSWTPSDDGPDLRIIIAVTTSLAEYDNTYSAQFNVGGRTLTVPDLISGGLYGAYCLEIGTESTVDVQLKVTDQVGQYSSAITDVSTMPVTMEFNASGQGIAFGKTSEKDAFECEFPAEFNAQVGLTGPYSERNAGIYTEWADGQNHDLLVRGKDGLTVGVGWVGNDTHKTTLELRGKTIKFRGSVGEATTSTYTTGTGTTTSNTSQEVFKMGNLQIITGRVQIPNNSYVTVAFKSAFSNAPRMVVTGDDSESSQLGGVGWVYAGNARIYNRGSATGNFCYMAIGFIKPA